MFQFTAWLPYLLPIAGQIITCKSIAGQNLISKQNHDLLFLLLSSFQLQQQNYVLTSVKLYFGPQIQFVEVI